MLALGCFLATLPAPLRAEQRLPLAEEFFKEGDYFRSITEFRRAIHDSTDEAENLRLWLHITAAYMNAGRNTEALQSIQKAARLARTKHDQAYVCFLTGRVFAAGGVFVQARKQFETCMADSEFLAILGPDRMRLAIAATYFETGDWDKTLARLKDFETEFANGSLGGEATLMRQASLGADHIPYRSPVLAGVLSAIVPGLGQVYEGRYWDGLQAFVIVGSLGALTAALIVSDSNQKSFTLMLPIVVGSIGGGFYVSNIYGAANGARMSNLISASRYIDEERRKYNSVWNLP